GEIVLRSREGEGSVFTLYLPQSYLAPMAVAKRDRPGVARVPSNGGQGSENRHSMALAPPGGGMLSYAADRPHVEDDRGAIQPGDRLLLIIEDDPDFARTL